MPTSKQKIGRWNPGSMPRKELHINKCNRQRKEGRKNKEGSKRKGRGREGATKGAGEGEYVHLPAETVKK